MVFHCPNCHKAVCSGLSTREFMIIDNEQKLEGVMICRCSNCNSKVRLRVEGVITKTTSIIEEN